MPPINSRPARLSHNEGDPGQFVPIRANKGRSTRCIDGRPKTVLLVDDLHLKEFEVASIAGGEGQQMPGGSLFPVVLRSIHGNLHGSAGDAIGPGTFVRDLWKLEEQGYGIGLHRATHHGHGEKNESGCGFADQLVTIIDHAKDSNNQDAIRDKLLFLYKTGQSGFERYLQSIGIIGQQAFEASLQTAFSRILAYNTDNVEATGTTLIEMAESRSNMRTREQTAQVPELDGSHNEKFAFINVDPTVTFDAERANRQGWQAFNMDLCGVVEQARVVNVDQQFAAAVSLILYIATLTTLGKGNIPVIVNG